jgi:Nucleotidyl transferase AbiEii toxin, Type IV TA system
MASEFSPKLSILPVEQLRLWPELSELPALFVLCGGTAIALQLGHRSSLDFDFIAPTGFDPDTLYAETSFLLGSKPIQKSASTLTCIVERGGPIHVSFFGTPAIRLINPPLVAPDNGLRVASLLDLAGMKAAVVQKRAEAKDYIDLDAMIQVGAINLPAALGAARELYGSVFNPELTLKSLTFFGDGNLASVPRSTQKRLLDAVQLVDLNSLPEIKRA